MDKCAFCGAETELYQSNVPICVECSEQREKAEKGGQTVSIDGSKSEGPTKLRG